MPAPPKNPKEVHQLLDKCKPPDKRKPPGCGSVHSNVPRLSYRAPVAQGLFPQTLCISSWWRQTPVPERDINCGEESGHLRRGLTGMSSPIFFQ